jgi:transposase
MKGVYMSSKEQRTYQLCQDYLAGRLTIQEVSILIPKSYRQTQRLVNKIKLQGMVGIKHGNSGKTPYNKTPQQLESEVKSLLKNDYYDFNLTHFREMIEEKEGITIGKNIIHRIATKNGLVKRPKRRAASKKHKPRARLPASGMLIQFDGSVETWFNNIVCDLIGGIDDATGEIVGLEFFHGETSLHCMKVMKDITINYGVPDAYYLDAAGYFGKVDRDTETQIGRALEQLGSKVLIAGSSQAKGRIERLWDTLQDRLIAELRFYQIKTMEEANLFLKEDFIPRFNKQFGVAPREKESKFKKVSEENLDLVFCRKNKRKISATESFSFGGETYVLEETFKYKYRSININLHIDGSQSFDIIGRPVKVKKASENVTKTSEAAIKAA